MKILYFFTVLDIRFKRIYRFLKKFEINKTVRYLKKNYQNNSISIKLYCINRPESYLKKFNFKFQNLSVLNEYLNIDREEYRNLVQDIWHAIKDLYEDLSNINLTMFSYLWKILEGDFKFRLTGNLEIIEFIKDELNKGKELYAGDRVNLPEYNPRDCE